MCTVSENRDRSAHHQSRTIRQSHPSRSLNQFISAQQPKPSSNRPIPRAHRVQQRRRPRRRNMRMAPLCRTIAIRDGHHMPRSAGVRASRPRAATAGRPTASGCHAGQDVLVCCSLSVQQFNCIILAAYPTCTLPSGVHPVNVSILSSAGHVLREQLPRTDCARVLLLDIARLYPQGRSLHSWRCMAPQYQVYHPPAASHQDQHTAAPEIQPGGGAVQMQTCAVRCAHDHNACCGCSMDGWIGLTVRWQRCGCRGSMNIPGRGAAQPAHTMNSTILVILCTRLKILNLVESIWGHTCR